MNKTLPVCRSFLGEKYNMHIETCSHDFIFRLALDRRCTSLNERTHTEMNEVKVNEKGLFQQSTNLEARMGIRGLRKW